MTIECSQSVHSIVYIFSEFVLLLLRYRLVLEAMDRRRNPSAAVYKCVTAELVDRHNRRIAQQSAKLNGFANPLADNGDQANSGCLVIDHTDRHFIRDDAGNRGCRSISRNCDHIKTYRTYTSHRFQLLNRQRTCINRINHTLILTDRNKCATQTTNCCGSHNAALLNLVI